MKIKALTLWQPWASFMALGLKKNETRSWSTSYRGPLAIHAAKTTEWDEIPIDVLQLARRRIAPANLWPFGKILCVVDLYDVSDTWNQDIEPTERLLGNYDFGRFAWLTKMLSVFDEPIPCKGHQGLWDWEWKEGEQYANGNRLS